MQLEVTNFGSTYNVSNLLWLAIVPSQHKGKLQ